MKKLLLLTIIIFFNNYTNAQWSDDPLENTAVVISDGEQTIPKIATHTDGTTYVCWFSNEGGNYNVRMQKFDVYGYKQWDAAGILVSDNTSMTWLTDWDMCVDANGGAVIVFQDIRTGNNNIFAYRISASGDFSWGEDGLQLSNSTAFDAAPKVCATPAGNVIVAWQADDVIIRQKISNEGSLMWGSDGISLSGSDTYSWPQLMPVGNDSVIMKFFEDTGPSYSPTRHVFAQKFDADGDPIWTSDAVISNAGGIAAWTQIFPMVNDGNDGFYIAWHDDRDNDMNSSVFVQHISNSGAVLFTSNGVEASTQASRQHFYPYLAKVPGNDHIFVYWNEMDADQNNRGIYGQKITSTGTKQWGSNGKVFIEISSTDILPFAADNSTTDMVVFYEEELDATSTSVKAMRIDTSGNYIWTGNHITMSSVQSEKLHITSNQFNYDQWIAVWGDDRNTDNDIYGQNIQLDGSLGPIPEILQADFTADNTEVCSGDDVTFTDQSSGDIISWVWTFEGGTPGSSSQENPVISYNTPGTYDVQLIINSSDNSDTILKEEYIIVRETPAQASMPSGETITCQGYEYQYTTNEVTYATSYDWNIDPSDAGELSGSGTTATFVASTSWTGDYTIKVRATNNCGDGAWSDELECTLYDSPEQFEMSEGDSFCEGSEGIEILLYGSQTDIQYILYHNGDPIGDTMTGTGDTISFGYYNLEGSYSSKAYNGNCLSDMLGEPYLSMEEMPAIAGFPQGPELVCNADSSTYFTEGSIGATSYNWYLEPEEAGTIYPSYLEAGIKWNDEFADTAWLKVAGENECGEGVASDELEIIVNNSPNPVIYGLDTACYEENEIYNTTYVEGNTYQWTVEAGEIINGNGTHEITVFWNTVGNGSVQLIETNEFCTDTTTLSDILIEVCSGLDYNKATHFKIAPNPAKDVLIIKAANAGNLQYNYSIINLYGNKVLEKSNCINNFERINVSSLNNGVYTLYIETSNKKTFFKFIKL